MSIYTASKEKNIYTFIHSDTGRTYFMDVNTGMVTNSKNRPIKSFPVGFKKWINTECNHTNSLLFAFIRQELNSWRDAKKNFEELQQDAKYLSLLDRINSITTYVKGSEIFYDDIEKSTLDFIGDNFKAFAKAMRETTPDNRNICWFRRCVMPEIHAKIYGYDELEENVRRYIYTRDLQEKLGDNFKYALYYLGRGLLDFNENRYYETDRILESFFNYCNLTGIQPKKEDFYRQYINVYREYEANKIAFDAKKLRDNYESKLHALTFEDDLYTVVIPQTTEDFKKEADAQGNCVYSSYLHQCLNGKTHVVFIRHKDNPTRSLITCEVRDGKIIQYLAKYNRRPEEPTLIEFQKKYQDWLVENWEV